MLRSVQGKGKTGSGKTSSTYQHFLECLVNDPLATLSIYPQKEEEKQQIIDVFARAGRLDKLIIVEPGGKYRCNYYQSMQDMNFDPLAIVEFNSVVADSLDPQGSGDRDPFFRVSSRRFDYNAVSVVGQSDKVSAPNLLKFYSTALRDPSVLRDKTAAEEWRGKYHNQCMRKTALAQKTPAQAADWAVARPFWVDEYPHMSDKTRSSIEATCMNPLSVANTGLAAVMASTFNNVSPALHEQGYSIVWNTAVSTHGPSGLYLGMGAKTLTQRYHLKRKWTPGEYYTVLISDEAHVLMSPQLDPVWLSMCRSHGAASLSLTQTIASEYSRMSEHQANMLLSNYGTSIFNLGDAKTEAFASALVGNFRERFVTVSDAPQAEAWDTFMGRAQPSASVSEQWQPRLQPGFLQHGLRTGGPPHYAVDGLVIIPGQVFKNQESFQYVTFHQRR